LRFLLAGLLLFTISSLPLSWSPLLAAAIALLLAAFFLFWAEWAVERAVSRDPEHSAGRMLIFVRVVLAIFYIPLVVVLAFSDDKKGEVEQASLVTEDDLRSLVDAGQEEGVVEEEERRMIHSIFQLGDTLAREIMVPRIDMLAFDVNTPLLQAVDELIRSGHSRVPVYEDTIDNTLGVLYAKDLLRVWRSGEVEVSLRDLLRKPYFVPEAKKVDDLLAEMQSRRIHIVMVVDEYGGIAGMVTLEDIVEEVIGEIRDEYDQAEELPFQALKEGGYLFKGGITLDDFNDVMESELPTDEADTLGGYIYSRLGRVPLAGEIIQVDDLALTVEQVSARRIRKVRARWTKSEPRNEEKKHDIG
jgi:CBS domain containing-hemolysin-like protein